MKPNKYSACFVLIASFFLVGCDLDQPWEEEATEISKYITDHNITTQPLASGLYYIETKTGTGTAATYGKTVVVNYTGKYLDGTTFDTGTNYSFILGMGYVIDGWDEGVAYMKEGGKATLIIPSDLAYGTYGYGGIPGYTPLVFTIELVDVK